MRVISMSRRREPWTALLNAGALAALLQACSFPEYRFDEASAGDGSALPQAGEAAAGAGSRATMASAGGATAGTGGAAAGGAAIGGAAAAGGEAKASNVA